MISQNTTKFSIVVSLAHRIGRALPQVQYFVCMTTVKYALVAHMKT
uniref:Uncharacterized protein n=1 Tax=Arundo donax TaxID=35708 RepID=A0A0A9AWL9_ARUDO